MSCVRRIAINDCTGGFGLSAEAESILSEQLGRPVGSFEVQRFIEDESTPEHYVIKRDDPVLISLIETLGSAASASYSQIRIIEIPGDIEWGFVDEGGGREIIIDRTGYSDEGVCGPIRTWQLVRYRGQTEYVAQEQSRCFEDGEITY